MKKNNTVIIDYARTPFGSFLGGLSSFSASELGAFAIKGLMEKVKLESSKIDEVIMGNVLSAGIGQAPARQAAIYAGLQKSTHCMTINKVCGSGMKAVMLADQSLRSEHSNLIIAGGMESMTNVPHYLKNSRIGSKLGDIKQIDGMINDGLWDIYDQTHMGGHGETCAESYNISREDQDNYAAKSYKRSQKAMSSGILNDEIVDIFDDKGERIDIKDEEPLRVKFDKIKSLRSVFKKDGTITAANASTINDGAAVCMLTLEHKADELNLKPKARILDSVSFSHEPKWFTTAPISAINKILENNNLGIDDIDLFEINEAFSVVPLVAMKKLNINIEKLNVNGGAISLGHPIGCSGARIIMSLINGLNNRNKKIGIASICIGGGEATAMLIEKI
ncbi:MAG: acetyl-CoA C-acyltransferase [Candidatus Marinimicrobia bacterium]|nr:acetyl-CoA C-acyltransferase [Candidatus Neomarinimicrobiota bacterium]|tara:strand:- start:847 stop:2022 length:1176 start_codon:yes stop_codon:yes gene_type:complete